MTAVLEPYPPPMAAPALETGKRASSEPHRGGLTGVRRSGGVKTADKGVVGSVESSGATAIF
jgi:hypothetical protein